jgi:hypothetical protein
MRKTRDIREISNCGDYAEKRRQWSQLMSWIYISTATDDNSLCCHPRQPVDSIQAKKEERKRKKALEQLELQRPSVTTLQATQLPLAPFHHDHAS